MEAVVSGPWTRPNRRNRETALSTESDNISEDIPDVTEFIDEQFVKALADIKIVITDKEQLLVSKQEKVTDKRAKAKGEVKQLFDALHELLKRKEVELNSRIESVYDELDSKITENIEKIHYMRDPVDETLDKHKYGVGNVTNDVLRSLHSDTESKLQSNYLLSGTIEDIPEFFVNFDAKRTVESLKYGTFSSDFEQDSQSVVERTETLETDNNGSGTDETNVIRARDGNLGTLQSGPSTGAEGQESFTDYYERDNELNTDSTGSMGHISSDEMGSNVDEATAPSAPPLALIDNDAEEEADPPPYWQAIGLSGPLAESHTLASPSINVVGYPEPAPGYSEFDSNPDHLANNMEHWHSFPIKRKYDGRQPLYVAVSYDKDRICIADRNNKKLKFFSHFGDPVAEMYIASGEIYDVAFLECLGGECRYIITLPKDKKLLLVAVMADHSTKLVRKLFTDTGYTSICRGPYEQTLVGAVTPTNAPLHFREKPRVELFNFEGKVLCTLDRANDFINFQYPRSVAVVDQTIVVADWKLSFVATFATNGALLGQYNGTPMNPLHNPLDLTVDKFKNIMIVDGENPSVHVITPECSPVEVLRVPLVGSSRLKPKLATFSTRNDTLGVVNSEGSMGLFSFIGGYRRSRYLRTTMQPTNRMSPNMELVEESIPYVEGMLPTTIASIGRQRRSNRGPQFYL